MNPSVSKSLTNECVEVLQFLRSIHEMKKIGDDLSIDPESEKLLEAVTIGHHIGKPFSVTEVMKLNYIGSAATMHRRMSKLLKQKLITQEYLGVNKRYKYLVPSETAIHYFQKINTFLIQH